MFDASAAFAVNNIGNRQEFPEDQDRLDIANKTRASILPWRGQFSPQLIDYLIERNAPHATFIVDPFCGSGTVLYEAAEHDKSAYAVDINPAAICLASFSGICSTPIKDRFSIISDVRSFVSSLRKSSDNKYLDIIEADEAALHLMECDLCALSTNAIRAALLVAFGNQRSTTITKTVRALRSIENSILSAPHTRQDIRTEIGDARDLPVEDQTVDYIVTSPPYINVFNYHQNYRPITESLGYKPLPMARSEIGSNRKFRQNRYMTVVQYSIDMALFLEEASRILKPSGCMTIVLGRESNVRGVAFRNGEIIGALAVEGLGWTAQSWHERKFMNRFGETIFEDVITLTPPTFTSDVDKIGRLVGTEALRIALKITPSERAKEINEAINSAPQIMPSPYVLRDKEVSYD